MNKRTLLRQKVWLKYNKHCGYCGKILEYKNMQTDHVKSKAFYDDNSFGNLMPSCRRCNHYKGEENLEGFRRLMRTLHERLENQYTIKVAIDYGIVCIKPFSGKFYFEKIGGGIDDSNKNKKG